MSTQKLTAALTYWFFSLSAVQWKKTLPQTQWIHGERTQGKWPSESAQLKAVITLLTIFPHRTLKSGDNRDTEVSGHSSRAQVPSLSQKVYAVQPTWNRKSTSGWVSQLSDEWSNPNSSHNSVITRRGHDGVLILCFIPQCPVAQQQAVFAKYKKIRMFQKSSSEKRRGKKWWKLPLFLFYLVWM